MKEFQINTDKAFLRKRLGHMSQLCGLKRYRLSEGRADGVDAVDVKTGAGLNYTVLPGRGMDIAWTEYKGVPVSYMSNTGVNHASRYDSNGMEWLSNFFAGLLTTCGFSNVGGPSETVHPVIGKRNLSLHGKLTNIPASQVSTFEGWEDDKYVMSVSGKMRESCLHGENITLRRTIKSILGENKIILHDFIENESNREQPCMLLYHMNLGYPILSEDARLVTSSESIVGASSKAQEELDIHNVFSAPISGQTERCYFHKLRKDKDGNTKIAVVNDKLELAVVFTYKPEQLSCLTEWKMLNEGEYVLGIEPGTANPIGRERAEKEGKLKTLSVGETHQVDIIIEIIDGKENIEKIETEIKGIK